MYNLSQIAFYWDLQIHIIWEIDPFDILKIRVGKCLWTWSFWTCSFCWREAAGTEIGQESLVSFGGEVKGLWCADRGEQFLQFRSKGHDQYQDGKGFCAKGNGSPNLLSFSVVDLVLMQFLATAVNVSHILLICIFRACALPDTMQQSRDLIMELGIWGAVPET